MMETFPATNEYFNFVFRFLKQKRDRRGFVYLVKLIIARGKQNLFAHVMQNSADIKTGTIGKMIDS